MSAFYANKKKREELSQLSKEVFGTKGRWHKFVRNRGYTIESIEQQMLKLKELIDAVKAKEAGNQARPEQTANGPDATGGAT